MSVCADETNSRSTNVWSTNARSAIDPLVWAWRLLWHGCTESRRTGDNAVTLVKYRAPENMALNSFRIALATFPQVDGVTG